MASDRNFKQAAAHNGDRAAGENEVTKLITTAPASKPRANGNGSSLPWENDDNEHNLAESSTPRAPLFTDSDFSDTGESEDRPSTELTSPTSVTSPPYWTYAFRHNRSVSNVSVESVLPIGAITLQDNETEDDGRQRNLVGRDRNRGCWARSVQVVDHVVVNSGATNIGAFVVWNIRVETLDGPHINIRKRYSEFDDLRHRLVQTFPNFEAAVPELPPKSVISKFRPHFLEKRRIGLEYFLNCILLNPEFSGSPVLKEFLFS